MVSIPRHRVAVAAALVVATVAGSALAESKVACIDMQNAIVGTNEGARAIDGLRKLSEKKQTELDGKQVGLAKEETDLAKKCKSMPREQCEKAADDLARRKGEWQNAVNDAQKEIQKKQGEATQPILTKMLAIVKRIAQKDGYDIVVEKQVTHFERSDLDITDAAVKLYNSESNVAPLPASSATPPKGNPGVGAAPKAPPAPPTTFLPKK